MTSADFLIFDLGNTSAKLRLASATALPKTAPNTEPVKRSKAAFSDPPRLLCVTIRAVTTAQ